jgi:hypothetical protein
METMKTRPTKIKLEDIFFCTISIFEITRPNLAGFGPEFNYNVRP